MSRSTNQAKAMVDAWFILLRYRWRFIVPMFAVTAVVLAGSLFLPRKYRAEATFDRRTDVVLNEIMTHTAFDNYKNPRQSLSQEIAGGPAIDRVIEELRPYVESRVKAGGPRVNLNELRADLSRKVIVRFDIATPGHERIRISYTGEDPAFSRLAVNLMASNYIEHAREQIDENLAEAGTFFEGEVKSSRAQIEQLENEKLTYEIKYASLLPNRRYGIHEIQTDIEQHLTDIGQMRDAAKLKVESIRQTLEATPETIQSFVKERNPELLRAGRKLVEMERQYRHLVNVQKMTDRHPDLVDLREQILTVRNQMDQMDEEVVTQKRFDKNPKHAELELSLATAESEHAALIQQHEATQTKLEETNEATADLFPIRAGYRKISREIERLQREVTFWEEKLRRIQMAETAESGNRGIQMTFVRPCPKLFMPVSPDVTQILIIAIGLGLMAGAVSLLFAHRMDETAHDGESLAKSLDMCLLGSVSEIITSRQRRVRWLKQAVIFPVNAAAMIAVLVVLVTMLYTSLRSPSAYDVMDGSSTQVQKSQQTDESGR